MKSICFFFLIFFSFLTAYTQNSEKITLVIHGGAGTIERGAMTPEQEKLYLQQLENALETGYQILETGGTSIEAVVATITVLEDSPLFNAGKGAVFTNDQRNELDASIMEGASGKAGAVAGVTTIKNPILAALEVMDNSPHVLMAGKGAENFAKERGLQLVSPEYFHDERRLEQLKRIKEKEKASQRKEKGFNKSSDQPVHFNEFEDSKFGTVGAVALDSYGNIAAGTSTGGMSNKKYGRIGDSPIIGAGTYADNLTCGVSATGSGEFFIRQVVAYDISALMKYKGLTLKEATEEVIMKKLTEKGGDGGVVALDKNGNVAMTFNTSGMYRGFIKYQKRPEVFIYK